MLWRYIGFGMVIGLTIYVATEFTAWLILILG